MNKGNLSSHLSKLEESGYVQITKTFRGKIPQTLLKLTDAGRAAFEAYRAALKGALAGSPEPALPEVLTFNHNPQYIYRILQ